MDIGQRLQEAERIEQIPQNGLTRDQAGLLIEVSYEAIAYLRSIPHNVAVQSFRAYELLGHVKRQGDPSTDLVRRVKEVKDIHSGVDAFEELLRRWECELEESKDHFYAGEFDEVHLLLTNPTILTTGIRRVAEIAYALLNP